MKYPKDIAKEILMTDEEVDARAKALAEQISKDYENKNLIMVCTLKGAVMFFSKVAKYVDIACDMQFIKASSYIGNTTVTIGNVQISNVMNFDVKGKDILIVEDIVDTGLTCKKLSEYFVDNGCASVEVCTMLDKPTRRKVDLKPKYIGKEIPDKFVIGYGLDYNEKYRNLPFVGVINDQYIEG